MRGELLLLGAVGLGVYVLASSRASEAQRRNLPRRPRPRALQRSRLAELLDVHVADEPLAGKFYQVRAPDSPEAVVRAALAGVGTYSDRQVLEYLYCVSSSPWNLDRYGTPSTSDRYPARYLVPGFGLGLRAAFLPRNAEALDMMRRGLVPPRTVDKRRARSQGDHTAYGLLWMPPVCPEAMSMGEVTCAPFEWEDGSSTINPDPELLALLRSA